MVTMLKKMVLRNGHQKMIRASHGLVKSSVKAGLMSFLSYTTVLNGDMSFVGPRPERPEFVEKLAKAVPYYSERHRVKPGLTGWAQVCYSYGDTVGDSIEKLQYDLYYVKNYSAWLDMLILLQTAEVVMLGKGAQ